MKPQRIILILLLFVLGGCDKLPLQASYEYDPRPLDPQQHMTCWEYIGQTLSLSTMKRAVERCGLEELYSQNTTPYTYLLLDEEAFSKYVLPQLGADGIADADVEKLTRILLFHIVRGEYNAYNRMLGYDPVHVLTLWEDLDAVMTIKLYNDFSSLSQKQQDRVTFMDQCGQSTIVYAKTGNLLMTNGTAHILSRNCVYKK